MQWYENEKKNEKNTKIDKILITAIIVTLILIIILTVLIIYLSKSSKQKVALIDGKTNSEIFNIITFKQDGNGKNVMLVPIKKFAAILGYEAYDGAYNSGTQDKDKCYVISVETKKKDDGQTEKTELEVANFEADSNIISKLDLTEQNATYEYYEINDKVITEEVNNTLFTTIEGIEKAFNIYFEYNEGKEQITIYTLQYLEETYSKAIKEKKYPGYQSLATESLKNKKAMLQNMLIMKSQNGKYGVVTARKRRSDIRSKI